MRGWTRALLLAALACAAAGACGRGGEIAAPDGGAPRMDGGATAPDSTSTTTSSDTTGRWGGYIGGGG
ncbi:MAG: hypothetical protein KY467_13160 [Gemmatimonadetes bacterium]|nr:hypothetical protein [Gemmatimonadota bacterium]